jgi:hypothetical protein
LFENANFDLMAIRWFMKARALTIVCSYNDSYEALRMSKNF